MEKIAEGMAYVFGNNIDTDQIYPANYVELTEVEDIKKYAMKGSSKPDFVKIFKKGDIIIGGTNFGCGSSREHAAITLKEIGVGAIIAESFGRIFFRNAINLGIPTIVCKGIDTIIEDGNRVKIDFVTGEIENISLKKTAQAEPVSAYMMNILQSGGIKPMIKHMQEKKIKQ
jgi:3-isopropylmalate/(R)-2-methylmalate dehydratase small subunit